MFHFTGGLPEYTQDYLDSVPRRSRGIRACALPREQSELRAVGAGSGTSCHADGRCDGQQGAVRNASRSPDDRDYRPGNTGLAARSSAGIRIAAGFPVHQ